MAESLVVSVKLATELKRLHLTARQKAFADLVSLGWRDRDAYQIVGMFNPLIVEQENWKNMRDLMQNPDFQAYHPESQSSSLNAPKSKRKATEEDMTDDDITDLLSKDRQLKDLARKLKYEHLDAKTEMDVRKMIADLQQFKKEQVVEEEKKRIYYIPLKCHSCSLYINAKKKK